MWKRTIRFKHTWGNQGDDTHQRTQVSKIWPTRQRKQSPARCTRHERQEANTETETETHKRDTDKKQGTQEQAYNIANNENYEHRIWTSKQRTFNRNWKSETQDHETVPKLARQRWGLLLCFSAVPVLKWSFPPASSLHVRHLTVWVWLWNTWCNHSQQKHEHERGGVSVFMNQSEEKLCRVHNVI